MARLESGVVKLVAVRLGRNLGQQIEAVEDMNVAVIESKFAEGWAGESALERGLLTTSRWKGEASSYSGDHTMNRRYCFG